MMNHAIVQSFVKVGQSKNIRLAHSEAVMAPRREAH